MKRVRLKVKRVALVRKPRHVQRLPINTRPHDDPATNWFCDLFRACMAARDPLRRQSTQRSLMHYLWETQRRWPVLVEDDEPAPTSRRRSNGGDDIELV